ncbi:MAG: hypothetical protein CMF39_02465 [Legionellaceae bacterium]|nr:hypothetical protein [Legionellaceae bacterium]
MLKVSKIVLVSALSLTVLAGCETKQQTGTLIGAGAGALLGSQFGGGTGQLVATGIGAVAGAYLGGVVGKNMDETDKLKAQQALERDRDHQSSTWVNPNTNDRYTVTPTRTTTSGSQPCRDYTMNVTMADGKQKTVYGRACRTADGSWQNVSH